MDITIRKGAIDDVSLLKEINLSSFEANASFDKYIDMNWVNTAEAHLYFVKAVTKEDHHTLIAEVNKIAVGFIIIEPKIIGYRTAKIAEIGIIAVLPDYRSSGIGALLFQKAREWVKLNGYTTLFVNSYIKNEQAIKFYKKCGLVPIDMSLEMDA